MNPYVLTWVIAAGIGVVLSALLLVESILDLRSLGEIANGRRWHVRGRIASESIRFVVHSSYLAVAVPFLDAPTREPSTLVLVLVGGEIGLITNSVIAFVIRRVTETRPAAAVLAEAETVASELVDTARTAAADLVDLAARAADDLAGDRVSAERSAAAAERTAVNTERIAENTDPGTGGAAT